MTDVKTEIAMKEWESWPNDAGSALGNVYLPEYGDTRRIIERLDRAGMLRITELRHGTTISATSWVGRITVGDIQITVQPKITGMPLLSLLRYAYSLRNLDLLSLSSYDLTALSFIELLVHQLAAEVEELMRRGLRREYVRREARLAVPRGRIDIQQHVRDAARVPMTLPCTYFPRTEDSVINRVLLAGLRLGVCLTDDPNLRAGLCSRIRILEQDIAAIRLDWGVLNSARRTLSRITAAYGPVLTLIELLLGAQGVSLEGDSAGVTVPGFLFDMNRFFQALLSRFLSENLAGYQVRDEHRIRGMMAYDPLYNPCRRQMPAPRPDFVVLQRGTMVAVLDAKYRDLWVNSLPNDMLYQLAIYALSQQKIRTAAILYPTLEPAATEAHIVLNSVVDGTRTGRVIMRPINMIAMAEVLTDSGMSEARRAMAHRLAFGK